MLGNQLHFLAMSQGLCRKRKLFSKKGRGEVVALSLGPWASRRREELLKLLDQLDPAIAELDRAVLEEARRRDEAVLLMTHPGIGPVTSLAFVLTIGPVTRFACSRKIVSYLGLNPSEESSGGRRRLGAISKQGNTMVCWLLIALTDTMQSRRKHLCPTRQKLCRQVIRVSHGPLRGVRGSTLGSIAFA